MIRIYYGCEGQTEKYVLLCENIPNSQEEIFLSLVLTMVIPQDVFSIPPVASL